MKNKVKLGKNPQNLIHEFQEEEGQNCNLFGFFPLGIVCYTGGRAVNKLNVCEQNLIELVYVRLKFVCLLNKQTQTFFKLNYYSNIREQIIIFIYDI